MTWALYLANFDLVACDFVQNVGRTKIKLVTSNNLNFYSQNRIRCKIKTKHYLNLNYSESTNYSEKHIDHAKQSATNALKTVSIKPTQKTTEATEDLIGNSIADNITKVSRNSPQNPSETVEKEAKTPGWIYFSRKKANTYWWSKVNIIWKIKHRGQLKVLLKLHYSQHDISATLVEAVIFKLLKTASTSLQPVWPKYHVMNNIT